MHASATSNLLHGCMKQAGKQTFLKALMEVTHFPQLVFDPTGVNALFIRAELRFAEIVFQQRGEGGFSGKHAALDGQMNALEALRIKEAGRVADDHPAVSSQRRHGKPSAVRECLGAVADHLAAAQKFAD